MKNPINLLVLLCLSVFTIGQANAQTTELPGSSIFFSEEISDTDICVEEEIIIPEGTGEIDNPDVLAGVFLNVEIIEGAGVYEVAKLATCSNLCGEAAEDWVIISICGQSIQIAPGLYEELAGLNDAERINDIFGCDFPVKETTKAFVNKNIVLVDGQVCSLSYDEAYEPDCIDVTTKGEACFIPDPVVDPDPVVEDEPAEEETPAATTPTTPAAPAAVAPAFAISGAGCQLQAVSLSGISALLSGVFLFGTLLISRKRKYK